MSTPSEHVPPHYRAFRTLWIVLQIVVLLVLIGILFRAVPPGELIGDVGDWARDL